MADEKQARAALADMQARLARGPYDALGIQAGAIGAVEARSAFLQLTKIYHPARFARMAPEVQRLANEVFLALRTAYETLARPNRAGVRQSQGLSAIPRSEASQSFRLNHTPPPPQLVKPNPANPAPGTGLGPATPPTRSSGPIAITPSRTMTPMPGRPTPAGGVPISGARARVTTPIHGVPSSGPRPAAPPAVAPPIAVAPSSGPRPVVEPELVAIHALLQKGFWEQARAALNALIARAPTATRYQALLAYAKGREAQLSRRLDEARVELDTALQLDPDLQIAKTALAELFTRRK